MPRACTALLREVLASEEEHLLVEAADNGDFRLRLRRAGLLLLPAARLLRRTRVLLLGRVLRLVS